MKFIEDFEGRALCASQIAEMLDVSVQRVYNLPRTNRTFPKPFGRRLWGYIILWDRDEIVNWAAEHRLSRGRRKRANAKS